MGEFARQPGAPQVPNSPLELLTPRGGDGYTIVDKYLPVATGAVIGLSAVLFRNNVIRRPLWAGIHQHILLGGAGAFLAKLYADSRLAARAENDAVLKHYICLHPEDFPPYEKLRYKDVWQPWVPIR